MSQILSFRPSLLSVGLCAAALSPSLLGACGSDPGLPGGDGDGDIDIDRDASCGPARRLVYYGTDYTTGSAGLLGLGDWSSSPGLITLHSDAVVTCTCGLVVVLERLGGDNLTLLSPGGLAFVEQYSLGTRSNPYDAWFDDGVAYVSLYGGGSLVAVDLESGQRLAEVDLSSLADADGNPEPAMLHYYDGVLYVALQLLDEDTALWDPTAPSRLAMVSVEPLALLGSIPLEGTNPTTDIVEGEEAGVVYLGHSGDWAATDDGGIERVDLEAGESDGVLLSAAEMGGNIIDFVIVDEELGYATVNVPNVEDSLIAFDPSAGQVTAALATSDPYTLVDLLLDGEGHLIVTDQALTRAGLRVFDVEGGAEITEAPIDTELPPFSMCLLPEPE